MNKKLKRGLTISAGIGLGVFLPTVSVMAASVSKNGWVVENGTQYYYRNGVKVCNAWAQDSTGKWCFLNAINGSRVQEGWAKDSTGWCYINDGYWVNHAVWAKDSKGWQYINASGYWDSSVSPKVSNPVSDAEAALEKAETSRSLADIDAAKVLISNLDGELPEKSALLQRVNMLVSDFQITSVSVVNSKHVDVVFSHIVDTDTAENINNYNFDTGLKVISAKLQADEKTVSITFDDLDTITNNTSSIYNVYISNIKDLAGNKVVSYEKSLNLYDNTIPVVQSVKLADEGILQVKFSEPVKYTNDSKSIKIVDENGKSVYLEDNLDVDEDDPSIITVSGIGSDDNLNYTLTINGAFIDYAGNKIGDHERKFSLAKDTNDPEVVSIKSLNLKKLLINFSEPIDGDFSLYQDGSLADVEITPVSGSNRKAFYAVYDSENNKDYSYKIKIMDYRDFAGNKGDDYSKFIKFSQDVPNLESAKGTVKTLNGSQYAVFTYDRDVDGHIYRSGITDVSYIDEDGDKVIFKNDEIDDINIYDGGDDELKKYLDDDQFAISLGGLEVGKYTITLPEGFAKVDGGKSYEANVTFTVAEKTDKVGTDAYVNGFKKDKSKHDVYYVYFSEKVGPSGLDADNYKLDGKNIFSTAEYTDYGKTEIKLIVKQGAIGNDNEKVLSSACRFTTSHIYDIYGNAVADFDSHDVIKNAFYDEDEEENCDGIKFTETTGPGLDGITVKDLKTILVTFDEEVDNDGNIDAEDFLVDVDGTIVPISNVSTVNGIAFTLTLNSPINSNYSIVQVSTSSVFDGRDEYDNKGVINSIKTIYSN